MATSKKTETPPVVALPALPDQFFILADQLRQRGATLVQVPGSSKPLYTVPQGMTFTDLEGYLDAPVRIKEAVTLLDLDSFVAYVNAFKGGESVIFIDTVNPKVTAVLDYHTDADLPSWCTHKAVYAFPHTKEWTDWTGANCRKMNQADMGLFIEDHMEQITDPPASELLNTVLKMKEIRQVTFGQAQNLQNGMVEFNYLEKEGEGAAGSFRLPQTIKLGMAPFRDGEPYAMTARMRYRCSKDDGLLLWFELVRLDLVLEAAVKDVRGMVAEQTALPVYAASGR